VVAAYPRSTSSVRAASTIRRRVARACSPQLAAQLEQLGEAALVVGHSQGGIAALELASRRPDLVRGLIVLDAPVSIPLPVRAILRRILPLVLRGRAARPVLRRFMTSTFSRAENPEFRAAVLQRLDQIPATTIRTSVTSTFGYDAAARLATLRMPCTFVRANIPTDLCALPASVRTHRIDDAGHWVHVYAPDAVTAIIEEALAAQPT
jgi:pimeloyl-ACP methyl ester carboxylesterase